MAQLKLILKVGAVLSLAIASGSALRPAGRPTSPLAGDRLMQVYGHLPMSFEANRGQAGADVAFLTRGRGHRLSLTRTGTVLETRGATVRMTMAGASAQVDVAGQRQLPGKVNDLTGSDPAQWHTDIPTFSSVKYSGVYPGIDLVYYGAQGRLEYDFIVAPGADPGAIDLEFAGAGDTSIDEDGRLRLALADGEIYWSRPEIYQDAGDRREPVSGAFVRNADGHIAFRVGEYDRTRALVIDPVLDYSTYLGIGSDAAAIAVDSSGSAYVTGISNGYIPIVGGVQSAHSGSLDAFVTKLSPDGSSIVYSTFLGGNQDDFGSAIAIDAAGNAYVAGTTDSANFPTANALQSSKNFATDLFIAKLSPEGNALLYSTFFGGWSGDYATGIALDAAGGAYVSGHTLSTNFPTVNAAQLCDWPSSQAFAVKINPGGATIGYSTCLGPGGEALGIAADPAGNAYITGSTTSNAFNPNPPPGAISSIDTFVVKLNTAGLIAYARTIGGDGNDYGHAIAIDGSGRAYVTGYSFPVPGGILPFPTVNSTQPNFGGGTTDAVVFALDAAGDSLVWSTYLGGTNADEGRAIAVDSSGNTYVTGVTASPDFPTTSAIQPVYGGDRDAFVAKFVAGALTQSTYLGGSSVDQAQGIAATASGAAYVVGVTYSPNFPTAFAYQSNQGGTNVGDAFVTRIATATVYSVSASVTGSGTISFSPGGGVCPAACVQSFAEGTLVSLHAVGVSGSQFVNWAACPGTVSGSTCSFIVSGPVIGSSAVFSPATAVDTFETVAGFTGCAPAGCQDGNGGAYPKGTLLLASDGNFYGTTEGGQGQGFGTVYRLTSAGAVTVLHSFNQNGAGDGCFVIGRLAQGTDGALYGMAYSCGANGDGTIFRITTAGSFSKLHDFNYPGVNGIDAGGLTAGPDGNLYGVTVSGGPSNFGTLFRVTPSGVFTELHQFNGEDGQWPQGDLTLAADGTIFGVTAAGGGLGGSSCGSFGGCGTVFALSPAGVFSVFHNFSASEGSGSASPLVAASDGALYGTMANHSAGPGVVFKLTANGTYSVVHLFANGGAEGVAPVGGLAEGPDGKLYGVTAGNNVAAGSVFRLSRTGGALETLYFFSGPDGRQPAAGVTFGPDGYLRGTTYYGGALNRGTVFRLLPPSDPNACDVSEAAVATAVSAGGNRIASLQHEDGGWFFGVDDVDCGAGPDVSCANTFGYTGLGLLAAYEHSGNTDTALLSAAIAAGNALKNAFNAENPKQRPYTSDVEFLVALSQVTGDLSYRNTAQSWFAVIVTDFPSAADRVDAIFAIRNSQGYRTLGVWDNAGLIRAAKAAGNLSYANAAATRIFERELDEAGSGLPGWKDTNPAHRFDQCANGDGCGQTGNRYSYDWTLVGEGAMLWSIHDLAAFTAKRDEYTAFLVANQDENGGWDAGDTQITAFILLGLGSISDPSASEAASEAACFLMSNRLPATGGWPIWVNAAYGPAPENIEVDSEVTQALHLFFNTPAAPQMLVRPSLLGSASFTAVTQSGATTIVAIDPETAGAMPAGIVPLDLAYDVTTTALVAPDITVCFLVPEINNLADFATVRVFHAENGALVDRTILSPQAMAPDFASRRVCARVTSLSPLALGRRIDIVPPVITTPAPIVAKATSALGAPVNFTVTATDDSGAVAVSCSPVSGATFAIGTTSVTCTSTDPAGNTATAAFTVRVDLAEGRMRGKGSVRAGAKNDQFEFDVDVAARQRGRSNGDDLRISYELDGPRKKRDRFDATAITSIVFTDDPSFGPGRTPTPTIDTVTFAGRGKFNGVEGFTFEVQASDRGEPGKGRDTFTLIVRDGGGAVVMTESGVLDSGNIQSLRLPGRK